MSGPEPVESIEMIEGICNQLMIMVERLRATAVVATSQLIVEDSEFVSKIIDVDKAKTKLRRMRREIIDLSQTLPKFEVP